jgi:hypothetical protein
MNHINDDILLKYAFDLLDEQQRAETAAHLEQCGECRATLQQIQKQFSALDVLDEDETLPEELIRKTLTQKTAKAKTIPFYRTLWFEWTAVAAAVVLIFVVLLQNLPDTRIIRPAAQRLEGPMLAREDQPTKQPVPGHSERSEESHVPRAEGDGMLGAVKIVSADAIPDEPPFAPASAIELVVLPKPDTMQVTIYNAEDLTLVRDTRRLTLKPGWNWLQFMWDGTLIDPTSLSLTPQEHADKIDIQQLVYPAGLKDIGRWLIRSEVEGAVPFEITYFASGLSWRAFYMGTMNADETSMSLKGYVNVSNNSGRDFENAQTRLVVGETRLIEKIPYLAQRRYPYGPDLPRSAGEINYPRNWKEISNERLYWQRLRKRGDGIDLFLGDGDIGGFGGGGYGVGYDIKQIEKEGLSEYFLYTIEGTEDLPNTWAKRLPSFDVTDIPVKSLYKYDTLRYGNDTVRFVSFANDAEHELGETPIPEGSVKIYRSLNARQNLSYIGGADIKYIPVNEDVELNLGPARLVNVEPVRMEFQSDNYMFDDKGNINGWDDIETWRIKLTNAREIPVDLEITWFTEAVYWDLELNNSASTILPVYKKHDKNRARFEVTLPARTELSFAYVVTKYQGARSEYYTKLQEQEK